MTFSELRKALNAMGVDYYVKKEKGNIVKVHFWVEDEKDDKTNS